MKKNNGLKNLILILIMVGLAVGYYFYLANRDVEEEPAETKVTKTQEVLLRDMEKNYPPSPKEVIKYYAEISKCFYDGDYSEEEFLKLADRARDMYDDELKATQTEEEYLKDLRDDIKEFKDNDTVISSFKTSVSTDVQYSTSEKGEMAVLYCMFNLRQGTKMQISNHKFVLRKDAEEHWKILGWELDNGNSNK